MAKNIIFFHVLYPKSDEDFKTNFSDKKQCLEYLVELKYKDGKFTCPVCQSQNSWRVRKCTAHECAICHHQESVLSGTIFQDTHKPLTSWFRAIWSIASQKKVNSARQLQRVLGIKSYKTAWTWMHKLQRIMVHPDGDRLSGGIEVIKFHLEITKKCSEGNVNRIPTAIAMEMLDEKIKRIHISLLPTSPKDDLCDFIQGNVKEGSKIIMFHKSGEKDYEIETNGKYQVVYLNKEKEERHRDIISKVKEWVKKIPPGSIRKHLPYYLDEYTFRFNHRDENRSKLFHYLIQNALQTKPVTYQNIITNH